MRAEEKAPKKRTHNRLETSDLREEYQTNPNASRQARALAMLPRRRRFTRNTRTSRYSLEVSTFRFTVARASGSDSTFRLFGSLSGAGDPSRRQYASFLMRRGILASEVHFGHGRA